jgi:uncharacterized protein YodC (DUF2158 family)
MNCQLDIQNPRDMDYERSAALIGRFSFVHIVRIPTICRRTNAVFFLGVCSRAAQYPQATFMSEIKRVAVVEISSIVAIQMPLSDRQQKYSREIKPMNLTFCIGDLVRLKSGSPMLMVVDLPEIGVVTCAWRDNGRTFEEGFFTASLIRVPLKNALQRKA